MFLCMCVRVCVCDLKYPYISKPLNLIHQCAFISITSCLDPIPTRFRSRRLLRHSRAARGFFRVTLFILLHKNERRLHEILPTKIHGTRSKPPFVVLSLSLQ